MPETREANAVLAKQCGDWFSNVATNCTGVRELQG